MGTQNYGPKAAMLKVSFTMQTMVARSPSFDLGFLNRKSPTRKGQAMKISNEEVGHILQSRQISLTGGSVAGIKTKSASINQQAPAASVELSGKAKDIQKARQAVQQTPEVRDNLVNNLKSRIESGTYQVSGSDIADLMIRRSYADQIR